MGLFLWKEVSARDVSEVDLTSQGSIPPVERISWRIIKSKKFWSSGASAAKGFKTNKWNNNEGFESPEGIFFFPVENIVSFEMNTGGLWGDTAALSLFPFRKEGQACLHCKPWQRPTVTTALTLSVCGQSEGATPLNKDFYCTGALCFSLESEPKKNVIKSLPSSLRLSTAIVKADR